ncbi:MAG: hypothetical protein V4664_03850 [Patescibacteria group bacterium]
MTTKQISNTKPSAGVFGVYKRTGETPLQCLDRLRLEQIQYQNQILSYAGRLDPLASGVLLVLAGEEANRDRKEYLGLSKTYEVEVLFGVSTDTYDVLGLVMDTKAYDIGGITETVESSARDVSNFNEMEYPPFSSKPVNGKSLFQWAREGRLGEISIPKQEGKILNIEIIGIDQKSRSDIRDQILSLISRVSGDFRQEEISKRWNEVLNKNEINEFLIVKFRIDCESGVYMRSFAHKLGEIIDIPALALSIIRTRVGTFDMNSVVS